MERGNPVYDSRENCNAIIETETNYLHFGCKNTVIPNTVTSISMLAFQGLWRLFSITIPNSVKTIGDGAFYNTSIYHIISEIQEPFEIAGKSKGDLLRTFRFSDDQMILYVPAGTKAKYEATEGWKDFANIVDGNDVLTQKTTEGQELLYVKTGTNPKTCEVACAKGHAEREITIPNTVEGYAVTSIGPHAFDSSITSVTIPTTVTTIGNRAFSGCSSLAEVVIPDNVTSIEEYAFSSCRSLTDVSIPDNVSSIGNNAFSSCTGLNSVTIGKSVESIGSSAFYGCDKLEKVISYIESPSALDVSAFQYYDSESQGRVFTSATLYVPAGTKAKYEATDGWKEFKNIVEGGGSENISFADPIVRQICVANWDTDGDGELSKQEAAAVTDIGEIFSNGGKITTFDEFQYFTGVKEIGSQAFAFQGSMTSIKLPEGLTTIDFWAFSQCRALKSIHIPSTVTNIDTEAFYACSGLEAITVDSNNQTFDSRDNCNAIIYTNSNWLLKGCKTTVIPTTISTIGTGAFSGVTGMTSVYIPASVTYIQDKAFMDCADLTSISVDANNTEYDSRNNCNAIIWKNYNQLIAGCSTTVIPNTVVTLGRFCFAGMTKLISITIPESVTSIKQCAFQGCISLNAVTVPNSVEAVGEYAFNNCPALKTVAIGSGVKSIEESAFHQCNLLETITVDDANTVYDSRDNCNAIIRTADNLLMVGSSKTEVIPDGVEGIDEYAFDHRQELTTITIPASVKSIGTMAFIDCNGLTKVVSLIEEPFATGNNCWLRVNTSEIPLYVPAGTKAKYEATDGWKEFKNIVEMELHDLNPIDAETTVNTENLGNEDLTDNEVDDIYYNVGDDGYDATDGSIVIGQTTNMSQITDATPGSNDVKENFTGMILKVAKGQGIITVNVKTEGNAQLVVQVGNDTPMIASKTEKGDVVVSYDVAEDTYVYIYAIIGSSNAHTTRAASMVDAVKIYGITVTPGATGIGSVERPDAVIGQYYTLDGRKQQGKPTQKGVYIVNGRKVVVK